jgi:1-acyl-sn-glycerol-3-phosphate acyltransferase
LAVIGAFASLFIEKMPAANPNRRFPTNPVTPLILSVRGLLRSRPLALAVVGIAFFTFVVAYMRSTVYMLGESHNPPWTEFQTSLLVGTVALGIGMGSPLAGYFSGGKVELGLVPIGAVGMIFATLAAAFTLAWVPGLVLCIVLIGFFTGFYIVPQYTLLQHRAPKTSKGDAIATSNFINVTGAILASLLFKVLVLGAHSLGFAPQIEQTPDWAAGRLHRLTYDGHGRPRRFVIYSADNRLVKEIGARRTGLPGQADLDGELPLLPADENPAAAKVPVIGVLGNVRPDVRFGLPVSIVSTIGLAGSPYGQGAILAAPGRAAGELPVPGSPPGSEVVVSRYELRGVEHYLIRPTGTPLPPAYDNEGLPRYLFFGASLLTLLTLAALCLQMPDLFVRSLLWLRSQGRYRVQVRGLHNLPSDGPVILATNCGNFDDCMNVAASTDRYTRFVLPESDDGKAGWLLRYLARRTGLIALPAAADEAARGKALEKATRALKAGNMVGLARLGTGAADQERFLGESETSFTATLTTTATATGQERFLSQLRERAAALILPAYCSPATPGDGPAGRVRVTFGTPLQGDASVAEIDRAIEALSGGSIDEPPIDANIVAHPRGNREIGIREG